MNLCLAVGRTEARFSGVAAADPVRCEGCVRGFSAAATGVWKPPRVQVGDREASSHKKKALGVVAETSLLGTSSPLRSLFERRGSGDSTGSLTLTQYGAVVAVIQDPGPVRREIMNMRPGGRSEAPSRNVPVHECGSKSPVELLTRRGAKGA